jgi:hypothetical protein
VIDYFLDIDPAGWRNTNLLRTLNDYQSFVLKCSANQTIILSFQTQALRDYGLILAGALQEPLDTTITGFNQAAKTAIDSIQSVIDDY